MSEAESPTFKCIKCGEETEYSEFAPAPDPKVDYGYYAIEGDWQPCGVRIVEGVDMCSLCVRVINVGQKS